MRYISPLSQVLVALQFYANGTFQNAVGNILKISQPSVSRCIHAVSYELTRISRQFINFPENLVPIKRGFYDIAGIRGVIGAIDGTHVRIQGPHQHEAAFVNRKGYHSINVQAICTADLIFLSVNATKPGGCYDSTMLADSRVGRDLKNGHFGEGFLLGDGGYGCTTFLMTPYTVPNTLPQERFNNAQTKSRNPIERAFGATKRRFHCLHGELRYQPGRCCKIIIACFVLQNIARSRNLPDFDDEIPDNDQPVNIPHEEIPLNETAAQEKIRLRRLGFLKRDTITANMFQ
jgi:hypothetical protein